MKSDLSPTPLRILVAANEAQSVTGIGDIAEFVTTLTSTLGAMGHDIRLVLPAYPQLLATADQFTPLSRVCLLGAQNDARLLQGKLNQDVTLYLVDIPGQFDKLTSQKVSGLNFGLFSRVVTLMAINQTGLNWQPDLLHCNGWQSALAIAMLAGEWSRPATVYTLHQTQHPLFTSDQIVPLSIPVEILKSGALSVDGQFSYERGALMMADHITTPSPGFGIGLLDCKIDYPLGSLLKSKLERFSSVPAGIDYHRWSPTTDPHIEQHYDSSSFELKRINRQRLLSEFDISLDEKGLLIGYIGNTISAAEAQLIAELLSQLQQFTSIHLLALVSGEPDCLQPLMPYRKTATPSATIQFGENEKLNHRLMAGCDSLLLPSLTYPSPLLAQCALSYGTVPIVHATDSMLEILTDATPANLLHGVATAFLYSDHTLEQLLSALTRIQRFNSKPEIWWQKLALHGMDQSFHPSETAHGYLDIYQHAIDNPAPALATG